MVLESQDRRCGNCLHFTHSEMFLSRGDVELLQTCAQQILALRQDKGLTVIGNETAIGLLSGLLKIANTDVRCKNEKFYVKIFEPACSLWQPRASKQHETAASA